MRIVISVLVGLAVALVAAYLPERRKLPRWKYALGGACLGGIVGLGLADLIVPGAGGFWDTHAMFGGGLMGALFLLLTVLVIDEAIGRANTKRWRRAAEQPVAQLIATRSDPFVDALGKQLDADYATSASGRAARRASERLQADVAAAPTIMVLLASNVSLHEVFESARVYVEATAQLAQACREHAAHVDEIGTDDETRARAANSRRLVQRRWPAFDTASLDLAEQAIRASLRGPPPAP